MIQIRRLRVEIKTDNGVYGIDESFAPGLNFIASTDNTRGKSSVLAAVYYCLGLEQIIGGVSGIGPQVLTAAYKTELKDGEEYRAVLESGAFLEISNGSETITIFRSIISENKDPHLVTVYFGEYSAIGNPRTQVLDYYVHMPNSAKNERGFHAFLESFLHFNLPVVSSADGKERKLYLQLIFSAMFIEQKHGWGSVLSGMPILGIRESKKRVVEFLLNYDTLRNERERAQLNELKTQLEHDWEQVIVDIQHQCNYESCSIIGIPIKPRILSEQTCSRIAIITPQDLSVDETIGQLKAEYEEVVRLKPRVVDNFDELNAEFTKTQEQINRLTQNRSALEYRRTKETLIIERLNDNLNIILSDIQNNMDAARLQKFGSDENPALDATVCPVCNQKIQDNILHLTPDNLFMSIDDNIIHLKEQQKLLEFSLRSHQESKMAIEKELITIDSNLLTLRRLSRALRSDLYTTTDADSSEAIMLKKIELSRRIEQYSKLSDALDSFVEKLKELSTRWSQYLARKSALPESGVSEEDAMKTQQLKTTFINYLKQFNYSSITDFNRIDISKESLLPTIDGFDMKYDSSASDGIRLIWAFTLALLQISEQKRGNHPGLLILDEPAQQSIVPDDINSLISTLVELPHNSQVLMAITLNSQELKKIVASLDSKAYHQVSIVDRAFRKFADKVTDKTEVQESL